MREVLVPTYVEEKIPNAILPVEYTAACRSIANCRNINDAKYWSDKAEALAAWAKIYKNDQAALEAKRLKLHAYRRMSQLADELQPANLRSGPKGGGAPGPRALLQKHGLGRETVKNIRRIGAIPALKFEEIISSPKPPGIAIAAAKGIGHSGRQHRTTSSDSWRLLSVSSMIGGPNLRRFVQLFCRRFDPRQLATTLNPGEYETARELAREAVEWLDEFDRRIPKVKR